MNAPRNLLQLPNFAGCTPAEYNTSRRKRVTYEPVGGIIPVSMLPAYLVDIEIKLNPNATFPTNATIYLLDLALGESTPNAAPLNTSLATIAAVYVAGGASIDISDEKAAGSIYGYAPPTEWQVEVPNKGLVSLGRKFTMGIGVCVVAPLDESISQTASLIAIDARFVYVPNAGACP